MMNIARDIALNKLEDAYAEFLQEFVPDTHEHMLALHLIAELRAKSYDDMSSLAYTFMHQYPADQWSQHLYEFFHSEGIHRTKLDDLLETYWEFMDEPLEVEDQIAVG